MLVITAAWAADTDVVAGSQTISTGMIQPDLNRLYHTISKKRRIAHVGL
jgi:hypothetical protein